MIELPKSKSKPKAVNAKTAILFGKPKSGKSTIAASIPNNLIIDLEDGTAYLEAMSVSVSNLSELKEVEKAIIDANNPYDYITIDTITKLEEMVMPLAVKLYQETPMGKSFTGTDVRKLPNGAGYLYCREAFFKVIDTFKPLCNGLILIGHANSTLINKDGKELSEMDLDLSGKLKRLLAADADALGYVYREKNKTYISFEGGDDAIVEARPLHLKGQKIVVAESDDNGKLKVYPEKLYKQ